MKYVLKKDIIIPAGTVFDTAPFESRNIGAGHIEAIIGLSKDTYGSLIYHLDPPYDICEEYFSPMEEE